MAEEKDINHENQEISAESVLSTAEQYIETNQKNILIVLGIVVAAVLIFILYKKAYLGPKEKEAQAQMFLAEQNFERDSFRLALNGDGMNPGFIEIVDDYSSTPSGNLARYYAGMSYLHLHDFENAIAYLKKYKSNDAMAGPLACGAIGDAYSEMDDYNTALTYYLKAAKMQKNQYTAPIFLMKAAMIYEKLDDYRKAYNIYKKLKFEYPGSQEARAVDKYLARAKHLAQ